MAENSKIQWTHHTLNPWRGCTKVSAGCKNCYAETLSNRNPRTLGVWGPNGTRVVLAEKGWLDPIRWNGWAANGICYHCGGKSLRDTPGKCTVCDGTGSIGSYRARVFCASLADVFEEWAGAMVNHESCRVWTNGRKWKADDYNSAALFTQHNPGFSPLTMDDVRRRLFELIAMTTHLDWLLLTKRPQNIAPTLERLRAANLIASDHFPWGNIWLGISVENQSAADERIPHLLAAPAAVRFLSCEPLLGPLDVSQWLGIYKPAEAKRAGVADSLPWSRCSSYPRVPLNWVIVGGESGPGARPMTIEWARSIVAQCKTAGVACFVKQMGTRLQGETWGGNPLPMLSQAGYWLLKDKKGGDMAEWPEDLRVREFPRFALI